MLLKIFLTALHFAAKNGDFDVVKLLLENGTNVNAVAIDKQTALDYSVGGGHWPNV